MAYQKRELRTCVTCKEEFWFRTCYAERPGKPGTYCSMKCAGVGRRGAGNPNAGELVEYGSKVVQHARTLRSLQKMKKEAVEKLARIHSLSSLRCMTCGCDNYAALQVNHLKEFGSRKSGNSLWRQVINITDEEATAQFDLRCVLCNWQHFLERKYTTKWQITWIKGEDAQQEGV